MQGGRVILLLLVTFASIVTASAIVSAKRREGFHGASNATSWRALNDHALSERELGGRRSRSLLQFPFPFSSARSQSLWRDKAPEV